MIRSIPCGCIEFCKIPAQWRWEISKMAFGEMKEWRPANNLIKTTQAGILVPKPQKVGLRFGEISPNIISRWSSSKCPIQIKLKWNENVRVVLLNLQYNLPLILNPIGRVIFSGEGLRFWLSGSREPSLTSSTISFESQNSFQISDKSVETIHHNSDLNLQTHAECVNQMHI